MQRNFTFGNFEDEPKKTPLSPLDAETRRLAFNLLNTPQAASDHCTAFPLFLFLPPNLITTYLPTFTPLQHTLLSEGP